MDYENTYATGKTSRQLFKYGMLNIAFYSEKNEISNSVPTVKEKLTNPGCHTDCNTKSKGADGLVRGALQGKKASGCLLTSQLDALKACDAV